MVATAVLLLVYETTPASAVLTVGATIVKFGASARYGPPGTVKPVNVGVAFVTVKDAACVRDTYEPKASLVAVNVVEPAPMIVTLPEY